MNHRSLAAAALLLLAPACIFVVDAKPEGPPAHHLAAGWGQAAGLQLARDVGELGWEVERFSPRGDLWRCEVTDGERHATILVELRSGRRYEVRELRGESAGLEPLLGSQGA